MIDRAIQNLESSFGIHSADQWQAVTPENVLAKPKVGDKTLNKLRLYLAEHGVTLKGDRTPQFWQNELLNKQSIVCPFVICVDVQEKHPFTFTGIRAGAKHDYRPLVVTTKTQSLGPSHGDYTLLGYEDEIGIERKSMEDAHGTLLGWGERRERFLRTLERLNSLEFGAVVVECSLGALLKNAPSHGRKTAEENGRALNGTYLSWMMQFPSVAWVFCDVRRLAEVETFRIFEKFYAHKLKQKKRANRETETSEALNLI